MSVALLLVATARKEAYSRSYGPTILSKQHTRKQLTAWSDFFASRTVGPVEVALKAERDVSYDELNAFFDTIYRSAVSKTGEVNMQQILGATHLPRLVALIRLFDGLPHAVSRFPVAYSCISELIPEICSFNPYLHSFLQRGDNAMRLMAFLIDWVTFVLQDKNIHANHPTMATMTLQKLIIVGKPPLHSDMRQQLGRLVHSWRDRKTMPKDALFASVLSFLDHICLRGFRIHEWRPEDKQLRRTFTHCSWCHTRRGIAVCGRCQSYKFCSRACQRAEWDAHRVFCFKTDFRGIEL